MRTFKIIIALMFLSVSVCHADGLIIGAPAAAPSISYISSSGAWWDGIDTGHALQFGANVSTGNLLLVGICVQYNDPPAVGASTFSDDKSNTWTRDVAVTGSGNQRCAIYSAVANAGSNGTRPIVTATLSGNSRFIMGTAAFSGASTLDDTTYAASASTDPHAGNLDGTAAGVIVAILGNDRSSTIAPDANLTQIGEQESDTTLVGSWCYRITSSSGTYNDGWTLGTNSNWNAMAAAYK